jgi:predicted enzyme related to lactoylglutathione lyase
MDGKGKFIWYELMTTDTEASLAFYAAVVGWISHAMGHYHILSAGDLQVGGLMQVPGAPTRWMGYIGVDDVDAFAARVTAAGGAVHRAPDTVPGVGRFAVVADPQGADFVLFAPDGDPPAQEPPAMLAPGHVGWRELHADDPQQAFGFYAGLFGWQRGEAIDMGSIGTYQLFATGGADVGGMVARQAAVPQPTWLYYFAVAAIDAGLARVRDAGGQVLAEPMQVPGGVWVAPCLDPHGAAFALMAPGR